MFCQVDKINIEYIQVQAQVYFGLRDIGNVNATLQIPLAVSPVQKLTKKNKQ